MTARFSIEPGVCEVLTAIVTTCLLYGGIVWVLTLAGCTLARKISRARCIGGSVGLVTAGGTHSVVTWGRIELGL